MTQTIETIDVHCQWGETGQPGIVLTISMEDARRWDELRERHQENRLRWRAYGRVIVVTNLTDDHPYAVRTAPCGQPCRCAAATLPLEQAGRWFVGEDCTLDGNMATIVGRRLEHGIVATLPVGPRVEFAWPTIAKVMSEGGRFKS